MVVYDNENYLLIEYIKDMYFVEQIDGFTISNYVEKDPDIIVEMLFYELLVEKDDVNVFLDRLNDNKIKRALVLYIIDILKSQANVNKDYDDMLIRLVHELQL